MIKKLLIIFFGAVVMVLLAPAPIAIAQSGDRCQEQHPGQQCVDVVDNRVAYCYKELCSGGARIQCCELVGEYEELPGEAGAVRKDVAITSTCGANKKVVAKGGWGTHTNKVSMSNKSGQVIVSWDFFEIPDHLTVFDGQGKKIAESYPTLSSFGGQLTFSFPLAGNSDSFVKIVVDSSDKIRTTSWQYTVSCPGEGQPAPPPPKYELTPSDCCKQIVPDIGDPSTSEYALNNLVQVAINIYECILCVVGALILLMLVAGAFILLTSAGSENRVGLGKKIIIAAVIGGLIVFFSFLIVNFVVKALGGGFTDEGKVQIYPGAGSVNSGTSVGTGKTQEAPPTPVTKTPTNFNINFVGCSEVEKKAYLAALTFAQGKSIPGRGDAAAYIGVFKTVMCGSYGDSRMVAGYPHQTGASGSACGNTILIQKGGGFTTMGKLDDSGILVHEATHYVDCVAGKFLTDGLCVTEQRAFTAMADYIEVASGDRKAAKEFRCENIKLYRDDRTGRQCRPTDPKCFAT